MTLFSLLFHSLKVPTNEKSLFFFTDNTCTQTSYAQMIRNENDNNKTLASVLHVSVRIRCSEIFMEYQVFLVLLTSKLPWKCPENEVGYQSKFSARCNKSFHWTISVDDGPKTFIRTQHIAHLKNIGTIITDWLHEVCSLLQSGLEKEPCLILIDYRQRTWQELVEFPWRLFKITIAPYEVNVLFSCLWRSYSLFVIRKWDIGVSYIV